MTRKVVINRCWGGFSLGPAAVAWLAEKAGKTAHFFTHARTKGRTDFRRYEPATLEACERELFWTAFDVPNPNDFSDDKDAFYKAHVLSARDWSRDDPALVACVEALGGAASGSHAELRVVEIPDDVEWEVSEYDGMETVEEKHRSWS